MRVRGIRGAITVNVNTEEEILPATREVLVEMLKKNQVEIEDIASVLITTTEELDAVFPAKAARALSGWENVPLMCAREIPVQGSIQKCIRILMHINTKKSAKEIKHVFLRDAVKLRPDLTSQ